MRILLNTKNVLQFSQAQFVKTKLPTIQHGTVVGNLIDTKYFSIFVPKGLQNFQLNQIPSQNISVSSTKSNEKQNPSDTSHPDGVSIYSGKYNRRIMRVKIFSLTTSALGICAQPLLWEKSQLVGSTGLGLLVCSTLGVFTFITPFLIHFVMRKYVTDIRYNKETDEYTCYNISFFLCKNKIKFKVEEIHIPEIETMFTSMKVGPKKIPLFVDAASFTDTHHYARFMGYDKPLKFDLSNETEPESAEANAHDQQGLINTENKKKQ